MVNLFDDLRRAGKHCLEQFPARAWLDTPITSARYVSGDLMRRTCGPCPAEVSPAMEAVYRSVYCETMLAGMWAASGFPTVTMGHRTAAELMATKIKPDDANDFVRSPWPGWAIRVPTPMLTIEDDGERRDAPLILVANLADFGENRNDKPRWWYKIYTHSPRASTIHREIPEPLAAMLYSISLWGFNVEASALASPDAYNDDDPRYLRWDTHPTVDSDWRSDQLARALIVGCSLYLSGDPRDFGASVRERVSKTRAGDTLPAFKSYELQSSIKINLHHAMRDYVAHGGRHPSVQTLVSGHWKRQAHGPRRSQRKLIHVRPYWRGDVDAPVSERVK